MVSILGELGVWVGLVFGLLVSCLGVGLLVVWVFCVAYCALRCDFAVGFPGVICGCCGMRFVVVLGGFADLGGGWVWVLSLVVGIS